MPRVRATSAAGYLAGLPPDRRAALKAVRRVVRANLPRGYRETMAWGMIAWVIPLSTYPDTYNGQPLLYAALASQKGYCSLYLMCVYGDRAREAALREAFRTAGKKLDMGKSCIRFRAAEDLPLPAIGRLIAAVPPARYIAGYEASRKRR